MFRLTPLLLLLWSVCAGDAVGAEVKLLCGFEIKEMRPPDTRRYKYFVGKAWTGKGDTPVGWRFNKATDYHITPDYAGNVTIYRTGSSRDYPRMKFHYATESQGKHALWRHFTAKGDYMSRWGKHLPKPHVIDPPRRGPSQLRAIVMFNTFGRFTKYFPRDWSGYDRLLVDVKSTKAAATFAILLEDDVCEPYLDRVYAIESGKWMTVAFDLAGAAKAKLLDPSKMANLFLAVEKIGGETNVLVDNVRLAEAGAKSKFEVLEDKRPWRKPYLDAKPGVPKPVSVAGQPDRTAIKLEPPTVIKTSPRISRTRFSQLLNTLSAFDNRYMVLGGDFGGKRALVTTDGGKTWKGIDGSEKPTFLSGGHQGDRGVYVGDHCGLLGVTINTCAGGSSRSDLYFRRLKFTGKGWALSPFHLVDVDVRHCPLRVRVLRQASGRIWAVWDHLNRHGKCVLRLKASDDDGASWYVPKGTEFFASERVPLAGRALVPYAREGLAVLFRRPDYHLFWSYTEDGQTWSKPSLVAKKTNINAAVTCGETEVFFSNRPGGRMAMSYATADVIRLTRYDGKAWSEDKGPWKACTGKLASPNLSVINDQLCAAWCEQFEGKYRLQIALRGKDGAWKKPFTAAVEEKALTNLIMPRNAPPNFVPIAWATTDKTWVKTLRVPIEKLNQ